MHFHLKLIEKVCCIVHGRLWSFGFISAMETASDKEQCLLLLQWWFVHLVKILKRERKTNKIEQITH